MPSKSPLYSDHLIDCMAGDHAPTVQQLGDLAERIWSEGAADRPLFRWSLLPPTDPEKLLALRAAYVALLGHE